MSIASKPETESIWARQIRLEADRQVAFASRRGYKVLPVTTGQGYSNYGIYNAHGRLMAQCLLFEDAAEIVFALATTSRNVDIAQ
jgi:hypothetical protein